MIYHYPNILLVRNTVMYIKYILIRKLYGKKKKFKSMLEQSEKIIVDTLSICKKILNCQTK